MYPVPVPLLRQAANRALSCGNAVGSNTQQGWLDGPPRNATSRFAATVRTAASAPIQGGLVGTFLVGSTGHIAAPSTAGSTPWTILSYGVLRQAGASAVATMAESPGSATYDRSVYINSSSIAACYVYNGLEARTTAGTRVITPGVLTLLAVGADGTNSYVYSGDAFSGEYTQGTPGGPAPYGYTGYTSPEFVIGYGGGNTVGGSNTLASSWTSVYTLLLPWYVPHHMLRNIAARPFSIFGMAHRLQEATAAGMPTLTALTASNITTSGWRATLTAA